MSWRKASWVLPPSILKFITVFPFRDAHSSDKFLARWNTSIFWSQPEFDQSNYKTTLRHPQVTGKPVREKQAARHKSRWRDCSANARTPKMSPQCKNKSLSTGRHRNEAVSASTIPFTNTTVGGQGRIELVFHQIFLWGHTKLCQTGKFLLVTSSFMIPVLKLPLQFGRRHPPPLLTPPEWLPTHTHRNWRSNVH